MKEKIIKKLQENFNPDFLEVKNNSHLHGGHFKAENPEHHNQTFGERIERNDKD